jgi:hypothetical protein
MRVLAAAALLAAAVYAGDYLSLRYRIPNNRESYGVVRVRRYYAVTMKNGKPEYFFDEPRDETCVYSLFPHFGNPPCWYLERRTTQLVKM